MFCLVSSVSYYEGLSLFLPNLTLFEHWNNANLTYYNRKTCVAFYVAIYSHYDLARMLKKNVHVKEMKATSFFFNFMCIYIAERYYFSVLIIL